MRKSKLILGTCALLASAGCHETKLDLRPEHAIAGVLTTFSESTGDFRKKRTAMAKQRQDLLNQEESAAAQLASETAQRRAVWKLTGDKGREWVFDELSAATKAAVDAWSASLAMQARQQTAVDEAEARLALDQKKIAALIKGLNALGTPKTVPEQIIFYVDFALKTRNKVSELSKANASAAAGTGTAAAQDPTKAVASLQQALTRDAASQEVTRRDNSFKAAAARTTGVAGPAEAKPASSIHSK